MPGIFLMFSRDAKLDVTIMKNFNPSFVIASLT